MIWSCRALVPLLVLLVPAAAGAQGAQDKAAAEALFREGRDLAKQGKLVEACARFESSEKLDPSPGTLLNLGDCYEKLGKTASAWGTFEEASRLAKRVGEAAKQAEAARRAKAVEPQLARLTIDVPAASRVEGLEVKRDGTVVPEGSWGIAVPVDPGRHAVSASAPGHAEWTQDVTVETRAQARAAVPALASAPGPAVGPEPPAQDAPRGMSKLRLAGLVVGGAGVLLLGTGVYFGVAASSAASDVEGHRGEWDQSATDLYDRGERDELLFFVLGGAGLAAIGGGAALYFLGGDAETQVAGVPAPGGGVVTVRGTF